MSHPTKGHPLHTHHQAHPNKNKLHIPTVQDVMNPNFLAFTPQMTLEEAIRLMVEHTTTGGPVLDPEGHLIGFLSERDCLRRLTETPDLTLGLARVEDYMRHRVFTVAPDQPLSQLVEMFLNQWFLLYPVVHEDKVVGMLSRQILSRVIATACDS